VASPSFQRVQLRRRLWDSVSIVIARPGERDAYL
jgi:hypothetical protein